MRTPPEVYKEVCIRSGGEWIGGHCQGGRCENLKCEFPRGDWRGLQFSHTKHRGMGGTNNPEIHSVKNVRRLCAICHDLFDGRYGRTIGRSKVIPVYTVLREKIADYFARQSYTTLEKSRGLIGESVYYSHADHIITIFIKEIEAQAKHNLSAVSQLYLLNSPMWKSLKGGVSDTSR